MGNGIKTSIETIREFVPEALDDDKNVLLLTCLEVRNATRNLPLISLDFIPGKHGLS